MSSFNRRDALKLSGMALASLAARPLGDFILPDEQPVPIPSGRVCTKTIDIYQKPDFSSEKFGECHRDQLLNLLEKVISRAGPSHNPRWYRISRGYVHSGYIQLVHQHPDNQPLSSISAKMLGIVTVPYTQTMRYTRQDGWTRLYRLYYESVHWITDVVKGPDGQAWYRLQDNYVYTNYCVNAAHIRPISPHEYQPLGINVPPQEKLIFVSIEEQWLTAYESGQAVLECSVSTGRPSPENLPEGTIPTDTPTGSFKIQTKMPSRHMGNGWLTSYIHAYELPGVPWTMVFTESGSAFHGTYWHNNFGTRMSSGCVNMRNADALWLFRWANPIFDSNKYYKRETGTQVMIY
jgi:lipoprotein-anchoring transpeptidase ErfK/SrfK